MRDIASRVAFVLLATVTLALLRTSAAISETRNMPIYGEMTVNGALFKYVKIDLREPYAAFAHVTAHNALPPAPPSDGSVPWASGRWADNQTHKESLLSMYNKITYPVAGINTDYFGSNGAPQGEFTKGSTKYQYNSNRAVMGVFWKNGQWRVHFKKSSPTPQSSENYLHAYGGSPIKELTTALSSSIHLTSLLKCHRIARQLTQIDELPLARLLTIIGYI